MVLSMDQYTDICTVSDNCDSGPKDFTEDFASLNLLYSACANFNSHMNNFQGLREKEVCRGPLQPLLRQRHPLSPPRSARGGEGGLLWRPPRQFQVLNAAL